MTGLVIGFTEARLTSAAAGVRVDEFMGPAKLKPRPRVKRLKRTAKRTRRTFEAMIVHLLGVKVCTKRVTQTWGCRYNKSNHF
jgi:hypothetical protein